MALFPGPPRWAGTRKVKPLSFLQAGCLPAAQPTEGKKTDHQHSKNHREMIYIWKGVLPTVMFLYGLWLDDGVKEVA